MKKNPSPEEIERRYKRIARRSSIANATIVRKCDEFLASRGLRPKWDFAKGRSANIWDELEDQIDIPLD